MGLLKADVAQMSNMGILAYLDVARIDNMLLTAVFCWGTMAPIPTTTENIMSAQPYYKLKRTDLDLIAQQDKLSRNAIKLFYFLGDKITDRNKCSVDTKDISDHFKIDRTGVSKLIKELEDGLLIVVEWKQGTGRVIALHPHYYWFGPYELQNGCLKRWIADIRKKHWGSVVKETEVFLNE